jgi:hypothetical protein
VRLAQAALEKLGDDAQEPGHRTKHHHHAPVAQAATDATPSDAATAPTETATGAAPVRRTEAPATTAPAPPRDHRFPWSTLAVVVLFAVVGSYLLARRAQQRTPGQRR